jgi:hypothetical protein
MYGEAQRELEMCQEAKTQMANPRNYIITNVGPVVNYAKRMSIALCCLWMKVPCSSPAVV